MNQMYLKLTIVLLAVFSHNPAASQQQCLKNAWNAFNAGNYESAIIHCDQCIEDFSKKAERMQSNLESQGFKSSDFPTGSVADSVRDSIFTNWAVNDVSTACFIKGRSAEYLYKSNRSKYKSYLDTATAAYEQACEYPFGRCWDLAGWFWSPCEESSDRLPIE